MSSRPPFPVFPILQSERIRLRELVESDAPNIVDISFFQRVAARDANEAAAMLKKIRERYESGDGIHWGIEDLVTKEIVGTCGFYRGFKNESAEVGYVMKQQFRKSGFMTEAVALAVDFGFKTMCLKTIFALTAQDNLASHAVLRKNGFIAAGIEENGDLKFHLLR